MFANTLLKLSILMISLVKKENVFSLRYCGIRLLVIHSCLSPKTAEAVLGLKYEGGELKPVEMAQTFSYFLTSGQRLFQLFSLVSSFSHSREISGLSEMCTLNHVSFIGGFWALLNPSLNLCGTCLSYIVQFERLKQCLFIMP